MGNKYLLGEIVNLKLGKTPPRANQKYWDKEKITNNVWLSISDLTKSKSIYINDSKEYLSNEGASLFKAVPENTLIMSFKLSIGKLAITKRELRTNEAIVALFIKDEKFLIKEYLFYFLSHLNWDEIAGSDIKVKGKTLNLKKLNKIEILVPKIEEQKMMVRKLDHIFSIIDENISFTKGRMDQLIALKKSVLNKTLTN